MPDGTINLTSPPQVRRLLARHGLRPRKRMGQNFLIDRNVLQHIVAASEVEPGTDVLEIGAGLGVVTQALAAAGARVVSVEADHCLKPVLDETVGSASGVELVFEDFLRIDLPSFLQSRGGGKWTVVGNLPYYITTPIILKIIDSRHLITRAVVMVQREVAERLTAVPGTSEYGTIGLLTNYYFAIESSARVSRNVFFPVPEVDSELLVLTPRKRSEIEVADEPLLFRVIRAAFGKRRKTLLNSLSTSAELGWDKDTAARTLSACGIDPSRRGETLTPAEFASIANTFHAANLDENSDDVV